MDFSSHSSALFSLSDFEITVESDTIKILKILISKTNLDYEKQIARISILNNIGI